MLGREFTFAQLACLVEGQSEEQLVDWVDEALASGAIDELPGGAERYQFTHTLVQETLLEDLSFTRRVRLHARVGEALEKLYHNELEAHSAELAHHFSQA